MIRGNDPILLTPGPLTTSLRTKQAMLNDWGSWDEAFNSITASIRRDTLEIVTRRRLHVCSFASSWNVFRSKRPSHAGAARGKVLFPIRRLLRRARPICKYLKRRSLDLAALNIRPPARLVDAHSPPILRSTWSSALRTAPACLTTGRHRATCPSTQGFDRRCMTRLQHYDRYAPLRRCAVAASARPEGGPVMAL